MGHSGVRLLFQTGNGHLSPQSALAHWPLDPDGILATGPKMMDSWFPWRNSASHWGDIAHQQKAQSKQESSEDWDTVGADRGGQGGPGEDHVPSSAPCPLLGAYPAQQVQNELVRPQPSPPAHPPSHTLYLYKLLPDRRLVCLHSADERAPLHTGEGEIGVTWPSGGSQD